MLKLKKLGSLLAIGLLGSLPVLSLSQSSQASCQRWQIWCNPPIRGTSTTSEPTFRLVTTYNRGKNTLASLGIKNKLYIDNRFSELEGYFVATAWAEYHLAVNNSKVRECMAKYSTKTINDKRVSPSRTGVKYLPDTTALPFAVFINRFVEKPESDGSITVGKANFNSTGGNKLEISLNAYPISSGDSQYTATYKETAGTIGHELLHVFGFNHAEVNHNDFNPIYGNDVYESGWCIGRGGTDKTPNTFGLTDDGSVSDKYVD